MPHADRLAPRYRTVRVQPIHNELGSDGQPGDPSYTAETEREALRLTLDELGIASADFAGWSSGGRALIEFVMTHPERVRTLTLVEPAAYWILDELGDPDPELAHLNDFIHGIAGKDVSEDDLAQFLELAGFVASKDEARAHPNWERWLPHRNALSWNFESSDRSGRTVEELRGIDAPVLLVKGTVTADWLRRVVDALARELPNADVLELEGDHACHIQSMDDFLTAFERHVGPSG
jgi:pimeloyl-ACP methyl ester carboxylesterase